MTQYEQMQQVINNYKKQFSRSPHAYRHFVSLGISPENLNSNSCKDLPKEQVDRMKQALLSISTQTKKIGTSFVEKSKYEDRDWVHFGYSKNEKTKIPEKDLKFRIYIPIKEDADHHFVMSECLKILINSDIQFTGKVAKTYRNDSLTFEFDSRETAKKFVDQFMLREELKKSLGIHNPFISDLQGMGFVDMSNYDSYSTSYTSFVSKQLEDYMFDEQYKQGKDGVENTSVEGFREYLIEESQKPNANKQLFNQIVNQIDTCHSIYIQQSINANKNLNDNAQSSQSPIIEKNTQQKATQEQHISSINKQKIHPLDKYKNLIMQYDIVLQKDEQHPQGFFVVSDRASGQVVQNKSKEEMLQLTKDLTFAKSWIKACGNDLSLAGDKNEFGFDSKQWEYSFNDGAYETYNQLIGMIQSSTRVGKPINFEEVLHDVKVVSNYKYGASIMDGLLDKNNITYDWQLSNIQNQLTNVANTISRTELEVITSNKVIEKEQNQRQQDNLNSNSDLIVEWKELDTFYQEMYETQEKYYKAMSLLSRESLEEFKKQNIETIKFQKELAESAEREAIEIKEKEQAEYNKQQEEYEKSLVTITQDELLENATYIAFERGFNIHFNSATGANNDRIQSGLDYGVERKVKRAMTIISDKDHVHKVIDKTTGKAISLTSVFRQLLNEKDSAKRHQMIGQVDVPAELKDELDNFKDVFGILTSNVAKSILSEAGVAVQENKEEIFKQFKFEQSDTIRRIKGNGLDQDYHWAGTASWNKHTDTYMFTKLGEQVFRQRDADMQDIVNLWMQNQDKLLGQQSEMGE